MSFIDSLPDHNVVRLHAQRVLDGPIGRGTRQDPAPGVCEVCEGTGRTLAAEVREVAAPGGALIPCPRCTGTGVRPLEPSVRS